MEILSKVTSIFDRTIGLLAFLAAILIGFVMLAICADVFMRFVLSRSLVAAIEVSEYILLYVTFLGTAWVLRKDRHVKMDLVLNRLKPGDKAMVNIITSAICAIVCLILTWYGVRVTWDYFQRGYLFIGVLRLPSFPIMAIIPIGSFLLFIQFLRRTYGYIGSWRASSDQQ